MKRRTSVFVTLVEDMNRSTRVCMMTERMLYHLTVYLERHKLTLIAHWNRRQ